MDGQKVGEMKTDKQTAPLIHSYLSPSILIGPSIHPSLRPSDVRPFIRHTYIHAYSLHSGRAA